MKLLSHRIPVVALTSAMLLPVFIPLASLTASAQTSDISWHTVNGGGGTSTGGTFELGGTMGQPGAQTTPSMSGGAFELNGGFWPVTQTCYCPGDLNGDGKKDGGDIQLFVACIISGGNCSCADVDQINGIGLADVSTFASDLLAGPTCP